MIKAAFQSMRDDFQRSLFYWLTFVLTTTLMFVFFQIACSPMIGMTFINSQNGLVSYLSIFIIAVCLFSVFFANDFLYQEKSERIGCTFGLWSNLFSTHNLFIITNSDLIYHSYTICIPFVFNYLMASFNHHHNSIYPRRNQCHDHYVTF